MYEDPGTNQRPAAVATTGTEGEAYYVRVNPADGLWGVALYLDPAHGAMVGPRLTIDAGQGASGRAITRYFDTPELRAALRAIVREFDRQEGVPEWCRHDEAAEQQSALKCGVSVAEPGTRRHRHLGERTTTADALVAAAVGSAHDALVTHLIRSHGMEASNSDPTESLVERHNAAHHRIGVGLPQEPGGVDPIDCAECGHPHWLSRAKTYVRCPIEGCTCQGQQPGIT